MMVAGPLVMALGVPLSFFGNRAWRTRCGPDSLAWDCAGGTAGSLFSHLGTGIAYGGGMALIGFGAQRRAQFDAQEHRSMGIGYRDSTALIVSGAILVPTALVGMGIARIFFWLPTPECSYGTCVRNYQTQSTLAIAGLAAIGGIGTGMFAYGIRYRKQSRRSAKIRVAPNIGRSFAGLSLSGRL